MASSLVRVGRGRYVIGFVKIQASDPAVETAPRPFRGGSVWKAVLTDSQFWVPVAALALGVVLLVALQ